MVNFVNSENSIISTLESNIVPGVGNLIFMIGLPGSGKSRISGELERQGVTVFETDGVREQLTGSKTNMDKDAIVFKGLNNEIRRAVRFKRTLVIDATNTNLRYRVPYLDLIKQEAKKHNVGYNIVYLMCLCDATIAHSRVSVRDAGITNSLTPDIMNMMLSKFIPTSEIELSNARHIIYVPRENVVPDYSLNVLDAKLGSIKASNKLGTMADIKSKIYNYILKESGGNMAAANIGSYMFIGLLFSNTIKWSKDPSGFTTAPNYSGLLLLLEFDKICTYFKIAPDVALLYISALMSTNTMVDIYKTEKSISENYGDRYAKIITVYQGAFNFLREQM